MTEQSQTEAPPPSRPGWIFQRLDLPGIVFAVTGGAAAGALPVALLFGGLPPDGSTLMLALLLWLYLVIGITIVLPLWDVLYRWGCRRWWQASAFGAVTGAGAAWLLGIGFAGIAAIGSALGGVAVWWLAYRPRDRA